MAGVADSLLQFLSRKRTRGDAGSGKGRTSDAFLRARELRAAQQAALHNESLAVRQHSVHELYAAVQFRPVPLSVRHHELFGLLFDAFGMLLAADADGGGPVQYTAPVHADGTAVFFSTDTGTQPAAVTIEEDAHAEPATPVASRRQPDAESPTFDLLGARLHAEPSAKLWDVPLTQLRASAAAALEALLSSYESAHEQLGRIVYEIAGLQRLHFDAVHSLHRRNHPQSTDEWRSVATWALAGCGMDPLRGALRDEFAAVVDAVDGMARGLLDWTDTDETFPPADLGAMAHTAFEPTEPRVRGKPPVVMAPVVKAILRAAFVRPRASHAGAFDVRKRERDRGRGARTSTDADAEPADDVADDDEARGAAAAMLALAAADPTAAGAADDVEMDDGAAAPTAEERAAARAHGAAEREHRYGLAMLTLAQIATIGSRRNAPNLRKLRGLIDHATKTPPARVSLGSALRERGSQRDTDRALLVRAGRVALAAEGLSVTRDIMDSIDNASFQVCSPCPDGHRLIDPCTHPPHTPSTYLSKKKPHDLDSRC